MQKLIKLNKLLVHLLCFTGISMFITACNGGSTASNSTSINNNSPLAQYKALLDYSPNTSNTGSSLQATGETQQQSFSILSPLTLDAVRVTLFSTNNCAYGSAIAIITMNGGAGTVFPIGTYTSSNASNYALSQRFVTESSTAALTAQSVRFDYQFNSANGGPGWVSAACIQDTGIGNYDPATATACTSGQPCGFKTPQIQLIPNEFRRAIIVTASTYDGNLKAAAENNGGINIGNGFAGADFLCNIDNNIPMYGHGSHWKALLNTNTSTSPGEYYTSDYAILITTAEGTNLRGFGINSSLTNAISSANYVWTGFTPSMDSTYSGWTSYPAGSGYNSCNDWGDNTDTMGVTGRTEFSAGAIDTVSPPQNNTVWNAGGISGCSLTNHLYCVQQSY